MRKNKIGKIIINAGVNVKPWEMHSAISLSKSGYNVVFIPRHNSLRSADAYIDNTMFEFKSPEGSTIKCVENNLQKALRYQSKYVVIDSLRIKDIQDRSIKSYLISRMRKKRGIRRLFFIDKEGKVIDIGESL